MNPDQTIPIAGRTLNQMMPMHLLLDGSARICHAGPTIEKLFGENLVGRSAFSLFELRRPRVVRSMDDVRAMGDAKVHLRLKDEFGTAMVGAVSVLPGGDQVLMNLSFGYSVVDAVGRYKLAGSDFAPTDLTVEMLYLVEAKTAAMEATTQLAHRLHDEKATAQAEALTDDLTGLKNRRAFDESLSQLIESGCEFSLLHIDLDFFKAVNDTMGHAAGDAVLRNVALVLGAHTRQRDIAARVGGDEFVVLLTEITDEQVLEKIAKRIINQLERPVLFEGRECQISASIGMVRSIDYAKATAEQLTADADKALYQSKDRGRACVTLFQPGPDQAA